jgi:hypothetical protein
MAAKGLDTGNKVLAKAVASRLIHALRQQCRRGLIDGTDKHLGARVWALPRTDYGTEAKKALAKGGTKMASAPANK